MVLVTAAWWPIEPFWRSDDWLALHYASDFWRALSDFWGNQYDLGGVVWFYRPLVTVSFALDAAVSGAHPLLSHLGNAIAHGISAMLLGMITARFTSASVGWWTALVWGLSSVHAGSVLWAVGRVDSYTVPWILLSVWLTVRWRDGARKTRLPAVLCFVAALCTKELAVVTPGIIAVLLWAMSTPGERTHRAAAGSWPFFLLLALYVGGRYLLFGRLGGYAEPPPFSLASVEGLGRWTAHELNPLWNLTEAGLSPLPQLEIPASLLELAWVGFAPAVVAGALMLSRRPQMFWIVAVLYLGCAAPTLHAWTDPNPQNLRLFTLAFGPLAVLLAAGRCWTALPALLLGALPLIEVRRDYIESSERCRGMHALIAEAAQQLPRGPVFVAGLPHINAKRNVVEFDVGVDRLLAPPFGTGEHRVFALRPFLDRPDFQRIPYGESRGLPLGHTIALMDETGVLKLETPGMARFEAKIDGASHLTSEVLSAINERRDDPAFTLTGSRAEHYRVTIFSGRGYMTSILPNEADAADEGGRVSLRSWLVGSIGPGPVVTAMRIPTALDAETRFPILVEAGRLEETLAGPVFETTAAARDWVWLEFDRDYAEFMTP